MPNDPSSDLGHHPVVSRHAYSGYARGIDLLNSAYNYIDLVPKARDEDALPFKLSWLRYHDEYEN